LYAATVRDAGPDAEYSFVVEDGRSVPDPVSRLQPNGVHGSSRVVDPRAFRWTDDGWTGIALEDLVIYELHVGTFTPDGTFDAIIPRLEELRSLGITAIELMPVAQFPGERNWGYDGVALYAVQHSYGGPEGLRRLVNAAHSAGIAVILDVVYNHVGPEGNYLDAFGPYFTEKYKTPWGRALNYDDADSDEVRRFIVDNARYWIHEYHLDGLRLDAVHGIFDFSARHLLEEITAAVHEQAELAGRRAVVIAESDLNDPKLLRPVEEHGYGVDAQWSDDFHHAVHATLTGESSGYYADYCGPTAIAAALREPFVFDGRYSRHRRRKHGASSVGRPRRQFVVAVQNHDQVGNRAAGDRLSTLVEAAKLRLAAALLVLSPYVPLLFMGEEYGETNPFQYFVSHGDARLLESVRKGRLAEFESFGWGDDVADPGDPETFERSKLDWTKSSCGEHARLRALYRDLLALRREHRALRPAEGPPRVDSGESGWITVERLSVLTVFNCSPNAATIPMRTPQDRAWTLRLSTDAPAYAGTDQSAVSVTDDSIRLPAWTGAVFMSHPATVAG
jgi:maltooligosyltrehalose trehalohydrolase